MKNNETGEFELVLGNRHLLSGFFVVALLFGVAFAMGYIVGRNSAPTGRPAEAAAAVPNPTPRETRPEPASPAEPTATTPAAQESEPTEESAAADKPADAPAQPTTQPAREGPAAAPPPAHPAVTPAVVTPAATEPAPGTYWQVIAVPQAQAEMVAKALKDKGFPTSLGQGPNNLVRVLVGPYGDTQALGEAKSKLENAGFHPILKH
ncbi:MAG TPA: SPOR domain-containing protein [Bryobacteraceae bacterium]|nr:SPOR domain-containing protein [Bryobacteraceae bacterium]